MSSRRFIIDRRYLPISIRIEYTDVEQPVGRFAGYILDIDTAHFTIQIVSLWTVPFRCLRFELLLTSPPSFAFNSDISETDETFEDPAAGYPDASDIADSIRGRLLLGYVSLTVGAFRSCYRSLFNLVKPTEISIRKYTTRRVIWKRISTWMRNWFYQSLFAKMGIVKG